MKNNGFQPEADNPKHWDFDKLVFKLDPVKGDVDLRPFTSPRHNQRNSNSCVAQSVVKALEISTIMLQGREAHVDLSVLAVYYLARELQFPPQTHVDDGTYISHACDVLRRFGACPEESWAFDLKRVNVSPSWLAMRKS